MKLIIQIPCFNEEATLGITLNEIPKKFNGVDEVEILIINDGSTDKTVDVARAAGCKHVLSLPRNMGLARAFSFGLKRSIELGADIIVNTDADNQYNSQDIQKLIDPIIQGKADIVIGERPIMAIETFSLLKKILQRFGSWVVRVVSRTNVRDTTSGFRAMSQSAAKKLRVFSNYSYTLETIIQAGHNGLVVASVPIRINKELRKSKLVKNIPDYIRRQALTIGQILLIYKPLRSLFLIGVLSSSIGLFIGLRFLFFWFQDQGQGHVQSLILAAILFIMGFTAFIGGLLAEVISVNRKLLEELNLRMWTLEQKDQDIKNKEK